MLQYGAQWLVLSDHLKVLRASDTQPEGLIWLEANAAQGQSVTPGSFLTLQAQSDEQATAETSHTTAQATLEQLMQELDTYGLLDGISIIDMTDLTELNFLYQGRVSVSLGVRPTTWITRSASRRYLILDVEGDGLTSSDRGTLDVSRQLEDGSIPGPLSTAIPPPHAGAPPPKPPTVTAGTAQTATVRPRNRSPRRKQNESGLPKANKYKSPRGLPL